MNPILRLCEDVFADQGAMELPALPRMIFVLHGSIGIGDRKFRDDEAFGGESAVMLTAGNEGATVWRWELITREADFGRPPPGSGIASHEKLAAVLATIPKGALLLRGDSVAFPPSGCAYLHRHQGPGIRCLIEGGIRIDTHGRSISYGPGGAWYETGPDGVFAQAADRPTRFIRVMILPQELLGKSSIEYLNEADKAKPKSQSYKIFVDMPLRAASEGMFRPPLRGRIREGVAESKKVPLPIRRADLPLKGGGEDKPAPRNDELKSAYNSGRRERRSKAARRFANPSR